MRTEETQTDDGLEKKGNVSALNRRLYVPGITECLKQHNSQSGLSVERATPASTSDE